MIGELVMLINSVRIAPVLVDPQLTKIGEERCASMADWSDVGFPSGKIFNLTNNYFYEGENLARGFYDATSTFQAFGNSKTHHDVQRSEEYRFVGVANCNNIIGNITVVEFAGKKKYEN